MNNLFQKEYFSFESDNLTFESITLENAEILVRWRSDPEIIKYFYNQTPTTMKSHLEWFNSSYLISATRYDFIICDKASGVPIGTLNLSDINCQNNSCEIGYAICNMDFRKKGYAKESIKALLAFAQKTFSLTSFTASVHNDNLASRGMIESLGFKFSSSSGQFDDYIYNI